jgi:uncharacterized protein YneF (UPF0154 family)
MKKTIITIVVIVALLAVYFIGKSFFKSTPIDQNPVTTPDVTNTTNPTGSQASSTQNTGGQTKTGAEVIGLSVGGRDITAYHYGTGTTEILFVGGIHGGYEWNTALVAYKLSDYLKSNPTIIPANIRVTVIPVLNPDGLNTVVGTTTGNFTKSDVSTNSATVVAGRFNGDDVDLNRNFDCDWQATGKWQNKTVSGGSAAFSEPESLAVKNYIETNKPAAVIVWYSAAGGVYASNCHNGVSPDTSAIMNVFSKASSYPANDSFDFYATTGDMTNWLAKSGITAISVLLTNHTDTEWSKNLAGVQALFKYYTK